MGDGALEITADRMAEIIQDLSKRVTEIEDMVRAICEEEEHTQESSDSEELD